MVKAAEEGQTAAPPLGAGKSCVESRERMSAIWKKRMTGMEDGGGRRGLVRHLTNAGETGKKRK